MSGVNSILGDFFDLISRNDGQMKTYFIRQNTNEDIYDCPSQYNEVFIECAIVHGTCGIACKSAAVVELWKIQIDSDNTEQCIPSLLLKNIIRSHAHFSQLNAWISKEQQSLKEYSVVFRYSTKTGLPSDTIFKTHTFPPAQVNEDCIYQISVDYIQKDTVPVPVKECDIERKLSLASGMKDLTVFTQNNRNSATPEPSERRPSFLDTSRLKHKPLPAPLSPDGPAPKLPNLEKDGIPARRQLNFEPAGLVGVEKLTIEVDELPASSAIRGRLRTKSGGATPCFHKVTGLPLNSSPAPFKRQRNSLSTGDIVVSPTDERRKSIAALLGSFEESVLNGRIEPVGELDGFSLQIAANGSSFCSPHTKLPVSAYYFEPSNDHPLPYYGTCSLASLGKRGYRIPKQGSFQAVLLNPQYTVVKVFVCVYDVTDMPSSSQSFIRQRYELQSIKDKEDKHLQYLIHLRISSDSRGRIFIHKDIRILFTQDRTIDALNLEIQNNVGVNTSRYKLVCDTQLPDRPRYSPKK